MQDPEGDKVASKANGKAHTAEADDSDDDDDEKAAAGEGGGDAAGKKKRKRKRKPKKAGGAVPTKQSSPPRVLLSNLFPSGEYPVGEEVEYRDENLYRTTDEEKRHLDRMNNDYLQEYRQAAEIHRQVRQYAANNIKPGQSLTEICEGIEDSVRALSGHPGLEEGDNIKGGVAFPTGVNLDHIAAHYSPNAGNKTILTKDNVMKVDFGVHVNGKIVDSAFTMSFDPVYDNLLEAVREGTNAGIREAGIDVRMGDIGAAVQETMESYEVEIKGETYPIKCIRNLNGHDIRPWQIHGIKSVPIVKGTDNTKMEEGEVFAIETFGSTGNGYVREDVSSLFIIFFVDITSTLPRVGFQLTNLTSIAGVFSLRKATGCPGRASARCICRQAPQCHQQELWDAAILQAVPGSSGAGQVSTGSKWIDDAANTTTTANRRLD